MREEKIIKLIKEIGSSLKDFRKIVLSRYWWYAILVLPILPLLILMVTLEKLFEFKFEDYINTQEKQQRK